MRESAKPTIVFASDHGGVILRKILQEEARLANYIVEDCGVHSSVAVDYPVQVSIAAESFQIESKIFGLDLAMVFGNRGEHGC